ncbi:MAG: hypothetical protein ACRDTH_03375 [Pseudonocardiaceae bacterium]
MKQTTEAARGATLRRPLVVLVAAGLAVTGCASNGAPAAPPPPVTTTTPPAESQATTLDWAKSMCQAIGPAFDRLGAPPQPDFSNLAATRQDYIDYLGNARNAVQQAIDQLASVEAPPVDNGQQVLDNMRNQLVQLRNDLDDASAQLSRADPNDAGAIGLALGAAGNILAAHSNRAQVLGSLALDPELRTAINETPECQNLTPGSNPPSDANQPPR